MTSSRMQYDNPDIKFVIPEEGLALWSDNMLVPNKAEHKANAEKLMNFYYEPEIAARLAAWVNYICPVDGAREAMEKVDPSLVDAPLIFPDDEMLSQDVLVHVAGRVDSEEVRHRVLPGDRVTGSTARPGEEQR